MVGMESSPIALPVAPAPLRRPPLPIIAAVVPVAAGVVLWLVSGSLYALCFAALGPLMIAASLIDGARGRRKERRANDADIEAAWARADHELVDRHDHVRERQWHRYPDAASCIVQLPLRGAQPPGPDTEVVIGRGAVPSGVRTSGGEGARARDFEARCATILDAPIRVALGRGLCLRGARPVVEAVTRGLIAQLCLRFGSGQLALVTERLEEEGIASLPHAGRARRGAFRLGILGSGDTRSDADAAIWLLREGADVPEGITTVIDVIEPGRASVRTPERTIEVGVEGLSREQLQTVVRERMAVGADVDEVPLHVALSDLMQQTSPTGLPATVGTGERGDTTVDIVADGPHAIVTGMTGTGKSELLVTWVTAIAQANGPDRVSFVLADFKGGTAFEPLRALPHVAAVITDLDEEGARRGVSSLTAELRRREALLARAGVRDVSDVAIPRLVIVVDEFAALLHEHPDLGAVFTDVAARGRALGMHLILGTQRASGVIRDALATNCPLRIGLRVVDAADSRLVIGSSAAADILGGPESRGLGFVRRPQDSEAQALRVARTDASDLREVAMRWENSAVPHSPWLPALPTHLPLSAVAPTGDGGALLVLGRADDPERQRQPQETLRAGVDRGLAVVGSAGAGRSTVLHVLAAQRPDAEWVKGDLEVSWDTVAAWAAGSRPIPGLVLCDDLDVLFAGFPPDHGQRFLQNWEQVIRTATQTTFAITASRAAGPVARVLEALPRRALLRMPSRVEHLAAGGEASGFLRGRPPGRARIGEHEVQIAWVDPQEPPAGVRDPVPRWSPGDGITAIVTLNAAAVTLRLRAEFPRHDVVSLGGAAPLGAEAPMDGVPRVIVGDPDSWQRHMTIWQRARTDGSVLVRAENPADLRLLAGVRDLPPYALPHAGRAWVVQGEEGPRRVIVPAFLSRPEKAPDMRPPSERASEPPIERASAEPPAVPRSRRDYRSSMRT